MCGHVGRGPNFVVSVGEVDFFVVVGRFISQPIASRRTNRD